MVHVNLFRGDGEDTARQPRELPTIVSTKESYIRRCSVASDPCKMELVRTLTSAAP